MLKDRQSAINEINDFINQYGIEILTTRSYVIRNNIDIIMDSTNWMEESTSVNERIYVFLYNLSADDIICPICKEKNKKFYTKTKGYRNGCSLSCSVIYQNQIMDKEAVNKKKSLTFQSKSQEEKDASSNKRIKTTLERHGNDAFSIISKKSFETLKLNGGIPFKKWRDTLTKEDKQVMANKAGATMSEKMVEYNGELLNHYDYVHQLKLNDIDENGNNFYDRLHIQKLNDIDENGNNFYDRLAESNYNMGLWTRPEDKDDFSHYRVKVEGVMRKYADEIHLLENFNKRGHANKTGSYHLDHKFSIFEGFHNNIPIYIIGHICNLEMIEARNNLAKNRKCSIDINSLIEMILKY